MKRIILSACLCILLAAPAYAADDAKLAKTTTTLDISAEASIKASPDIATLSTGVVTIEPKADQALKNNSQKMNKLFKALKLAGIAKKDIRTSDFNLSPQYDYVPNKPATISTYRASNNVTIILRDMKTIGPVMDRLVEAGSNQIDGPQFSVEDTDAALDKARQAAVAKAKKRAQLYADAAGLKIKRIVSISESSGYQPVPPRPVMMMKAMSAEASAPTPVSAGDMSLSVTVNMQFDLTR